MGHTTSISDYEMERGDGPPPCDGVDIEAPHGKSNAPKQHMSESEIRGDFTEPDEDEDGPKTKAKVVHAKEKKPPVTTTHAVTKDAKSK